MSKTVSHTVEQGGDRLDHYLAAQSLCTSRSEAGKLIKDGFVSVNGQSQIKTSYKVCVDDKLTIEFPAMKPTELTPHEVDFEILYE
ncbi:RluA family pseudouridine synthase, partial [bacterium]|nr:RluA family pseudouridine synthase [bacterium]MBU1916892.1 RluA family pseudouridine synthase [bacterium]